MSSKALICTVGLPRSGKTSWANQIAFPTVNPDSIRLALHGQRFQPLAEPFVWASAMLMVRSLFLAGHNYVIVDATNTTDVRRQQWIDEGWTTYWKLFTTSKETCIERAGDDAVIIPIIERMASTFTYPLDNILDGSKHEFASRFGL